MLFVVCLPSSSVFLTTSHSLVFLCVGRRRVAVTVDIIVEWRRRHVQEIGITHGRVVRGLGTLLQLEGLLARMCRIGRAACGHPPH